MYKKTSHTIDRLTRSGDFSLSPRLSGQREDKKQTGGGDEQLAYGQNAFNVETVRQQLLEKKRGIEDFITKRKIMVEHSRVEYRKRGIPTPPGILKKWENEIKEYSGRIQRIQDKLGELTRIAKMQRSLSFEQEFFDTAREILHPDVFNRILDIAHARAGHTRERAQMYALLNKATEDIAQE